MKKYAIEYLPEAKQDIEEIRDYISVELGNEPAAIRIVRAIVAKCENLCTFPNGSMVRLHSCERGIRFVHYGKYTIAYYVDEDASIVTIIAVKYSRMNLMEVLSE